MTKHSRADADQHAVPLAGHQQRHRRGDREQAEDDRADHAVDVEAGALDRLAPEELGRCVAGRAPRTGSWPSTAITARTAPVLRSRVQYPVGHVEGRRPSCRSQSRSPLRQYGAGRLGGRPAQPEDRFDQHRAPRRRSRSSPGSPSTSSLETPAKVCIAWPPDCKAPNSRPAAGHAPRLHPAQQRDEDAVEPDLPDARRWSATVAVPSTTVVPPSPASAPASAMVSATVVPDLHAGGARGVRVVARPPAARSRSGPG